MDAPGFRFAACGGRRRWRQARGGSPACPQQCAIERAAGANSVNRSWSTASSLAQVPPPPPARSGGAQHVSAPGHATHQPASAGGQQLLMPTTHCCGAQPPVRPPPLSAHTGVPQRFVPEGPGPGQPGHCGAGDGAGGGVCHRDPRLRGRQDPQLRRRHLLHRLQPHGEVKRAPRRAARRAARRLAVPAPTLNQPCHVQHLSQLRPPGGVQRQRGALTRTLLAAAATPVLHAGRQPP